MIRLILLLFLMIHPLHCQELYANKINLFPKTKVTVYNNLGNINLKLHCKSKHDDLGIHTLKNGEFIHWKFRESIIETTKFTCSMEWRNVKGTFDIYLDSRDSKRCHDCVWKVTQSGVRGYNEQGVEQIWFRWLPKPPT